MHEILRSHHPIRHIRSFKYAFKGLAHVLLNEANFRVQLAIVVLFTITGVVFKISALEWSVLILAMGFLLSAEILNTVVEELIDHLIKEISETARIVKDLTAGFVLVAAFTCLIVFVLIFRHYVF